MIHYAGTYADYYEERITDDSILWILRGTNTHIRGDVLKFYRALHGDGFNPLTLLGLPRTNEIEHPYKEKYATVQVFERGCVAYDPDRVLDNPHVAGACYFIHHDSPVLFEIADLLFFAAA